MVTTRGKNIKFDLDSSEDELDGERGGEGPVEPLPKRQRAKQSKTSQDDPAFNPGSSSGKGKEKATSGPNQLITRRNGRGGKLRDLMNMPIDIFTEVCSYLGPYDLRRLALTTKRLWDILMTKEARHVWKSAIASIPDLPECPTDLNEPQYVCLLYSSECYTVGCTSRGTKVDWFHRVRFCKACHTENFLSSASTQGLGLYQITLSRIVSYFDSSSVMCRAKGHWRAPPYYIEAIKKAGREYEALSQMQAGEYLSRLKDMRQYHILTGLAMLKWKDNQIASRADDIAAEKNARFESIKVKLFDLGWEEQDFPMSNKEFKDLVLKHQKLTPKVWQNIRPKLESLIEPRRNSRLEIEKRQRQNAREEAILKLYHKVGLEALNLPPHHSALISLLLTVDQVWALPSIRSLMKNDTETVTEDQWIEVAPEIRLLLLISWRDCLKQLTARLEDGAKASVEDTGTRSKATDSKVEAVEAISDEIEPLQAKFRRATSAFVCEAASWEGSCGKVFWFPHDIGHAWGCHGQRSMDGIITILGPLRPDGQDLVKRLLKDLKLDSETTNVDHLVEDRNETNLLCTRCDERTATYRNFREIVDHFLEAQRWFDNATHAVQTSPDSCYPSRTVNSQLPKIVNDHDWISRDAPLVRQDDQKAKGAVSKLQSNFWKEGLNDPLLVIKGLGQEDLRMKRWRETRYCLLCPKLYAPHPCWAGKLALHILQRHDKEPDLEKDTTLELTSPPHPCPL